MCDHGVDFRTHLDESHDNLPVACNNCVWKGRMQDVNPIRDLDDRISPGEIVPAGECPQCGALASLVKPVPPTASTDNLLLWEDIAAISADLHLHGNYQTFYDRYAGQLSGFSGIWKFVVVAAVRFNHLAVEQQIVWGETHEWIDSIDTYVEAIYTKALSNDPTNNNIQCEAWLDPLARSSFVTTDGRPPIPHNLITKAQRPRCGLDLDTKNHCTGGTCPFSNHALDCPMGWAGHPQEQGQRLECTCTPADNPRP